MAPPAGRAYQGFWFGVDIFASHDDDGQYGSMVGCYNQKAGHESQIHELTGPEILTIDDMVQTISQVLDKRIRYVRIPVFVAALWMRKFGLPRHGVRGLVETLGALRRSEYAYVTDAVERVGGCQPRTFEEWCRGHITAFR